MGTVERVYECAKTRELHDRVYPSVTSARMLQLVWHPIKMLVHPLPDIHMSVRCTSEHAFVCLCRHCNCLLKRTRTHTNTDRVLSVSAPANILLPQPYSIDKM